MRVMDIKIFIPCDAPQYASVKWSFVSIPEPKNVLNLPKFHIAPWKTILSYWVPVTFQGQTVHLWGGNNSGDDCILDPEPPPVGPLQNLRFEQAGNQEMQSEAMSTKMLGDTLRLTNRRGKSLIVSLVNIINIRWSCHGLSGAFKYLLFSPLPREMIQFWLIFFRWVETTNQMAICYFVRFFFTNWIFSTLSTGRKSKNGHHNWKRGFIIQIISLTGTTVIFKRWPHHFIRVSYWLSSWNKWTQAGQIIATENTTKHPKWWWKVREIIGKSPEIQQKNPGEGEIWFHLARHININISLEPWTTSFNWIIWWFPTISLKVKIWNPPGPFFYRWNLGFQLANGCCYERVIFREPRSTA